MIKYLLPWEPYTTSDGIKRYKRVSLDNHYMAHISKNDDGTWTVGGSSGVSCYFAKSAMKKRDKILIRQGFILIPKGKEDVYRLLK